MESVASGRTGLFTHELARSSPMTLATTKQRRGLAAMSSPRHALLVLAGLSLVLFTAVEAACSGPYNTLTSDCKGGLFAVPDSVCLVIDKATSTDSPCNHKVRSTKSRCLSTSSSCDIVSYSPLVGATSFKFYVVTTGYINGLARQLAISNSRGDNTVTSNLPYEIDPFVDKIGPLKISASVPEAVISGGQDEFGTRGDVASVSIDSSIFSQSPHLTTVGLLNLRIGDQLSSVGSIIPSGVVVLNLRNTMMSSAPSDISALKKLSKLNLDQNFMTSFKSSHPSLTELNLVQNKLSSFTASLPQLVSLDLSENALVAIPSAVYSMPKLRVLKLAKNPVTPLVLTQVQYKFLTGLEEFTIDASAATTRTDKDGLTVLKLKGINVVVLSGGGGGGTIQETGPTTTTIKPSNHTGPTASSSSSTHSSTSRSGSGSGSSRGTQDHHSTDGSRMGSDAGEGSNLSLSAAADAQDKTNSAVKGDPTGGELSGTKDSVSTNSATKPQSHSTTLIGLVLVAAVAAAFGAGTFIYRRHWHPSNGFEEEDANAETATPRKGTPSAAAAVYARTESGDDTDRSLPSTNTSTGGGDADALTSGHAMDVLLSRRIQLSDLEDLCPINSTGSSTIVWLVQYRGSRLLMSKRLIQRQASDRTSIEFVNDLLIASKLDHPNIVSLVGVAWTSPAHDLQALYEYLPQGDLRSYLDRSDRAWKWDDHKLRLATDVMEALVYTHSFDPPLLHRDLKAQTVLLCAKHRAKLSGFGSARYESESDTMTMTGVGTGRWLAPEILSGSTSYNASCDIYAFGVLLTELDTHQVPYAKALDAHAPSMAEISLLQHVARGELIPTLSRACPREIKRLARRCLSFEPSKRPSAVQVAYQLRQIAFINGGGGEPFGQSTSTSSL